MEQSIDTSLRTHDSNENKPSFICPLLEDDEECIMIKQSEDDSITKICTFFDEDGTKPNTWARIKKYPSEILNYCKFVKN